MPVNAPVTISSEGFTTFKSVLGNEVGNCGVA
jgi:hypothetical protein